MTDTHRVRSFSSSCPSHRITSLERVKGTLNCQDVLARVGGENSKDTLSGDMEPATLPPTINVTEGLSFQVIRKVCDDDDIFIAFPRFMLSEVKNGNRRFVGLDVNLRSVSLEKKETVND